MSFYKPPTLYRQNAVRRTVSDPNLNKTSPKYTEKWLYNYEPEDDQLLNKALYNNKMKIASNYWNIPDNELHLTSLAVNRENQEQLAISSGMKNENLFIYNIDYDDMILTHQQTITLPFIEKLKWCSFDTEESSLLTGHKNGSIHLVSVPNTDDSNAKILKRFNHKKHFNKIRNLSIKQINNSLWGSHSSNILSLCNENIFLWDLQHRSDLPILKNQNLGIHNFDSSYQHGIIAIAGDFGIALNDLRMNNTKSSVFQPTAGFETGANNIKWAPYDSNVIAASHFDGSIRLWDIRAQNYFGKLTGHDDLVTSLEWSEESTSDLYSGSEDGNIIHWDLNFDQDLTDCCLNGGLDSIEFHKSLFLWDDSEIYNKINKRQCGTLIPAAKDSIVELASTNDKLLSIDGSSFLGVHGKRGVDAFKVKEGTSSIIIDALLEALPLTKELHEGAVASDSEDDDFFDFDSQGGAGLVSTSTFDTPLSEKIEQQSITSLNYESDHSLNTLTEIQTPSSIMDRRRESESTLNEEENHEYDIGFTYQKILPLQKRNDTEIVINQHQESPQQHLVYI